MRHKDDDRDDDREFVPSTGAIREQRRPGLNQRRPTRFQLTTRTFDGDGVAVMTNSDNGFELAN